jgi:hypothetical protein
MVDSSGQTGVLVRAGQSCCLCVGEETERARAASRQLEQERRDLVGWSNNMPVYGPDFVQELCRRFYGRVVTDAG